jgi:hypothetical protein
MLKGLMHNVVLRIRARTGVTSTFFIGSAFAACALLVVFVFLCVTGYAWLSVQLGAVFGGLAMAGVCWHSSCRQFPASSHATRNP